MTMEGKKSEAVNARVSSCQLFNGLHDWRWVGWPLSIIMSDIHSQILDGTEAWCIVCGLRMVYENGRWNITL